MDITMRGMDGFAAAREIYRHDPGARIIFLSNLNDEKYCTEALQLGAVGYVNKHESQKLLSLITQV
jgi:two-component system chemotaxis response regulator CheY